MVTLSVPRRHGGRGRVWAAGAAVEAVRALELARAGQRPQQGGPEQPAGRGAACDSRGGAVGAQDA